MTVLATGASRPETATEPATKPDHRHPIVDVGIPTLGTSPYLLEAIESVFAQTLQSWRLFISENGPGDEALRARLEPYLRDPRVHHLVTGERVGVGVNHTRLLRAGSAPYVAILHDDDRWAPGFLERRVEFLERHPSCGFVFSGHLLIDDRGRRVGRSRLPMREGVYPSSYVLPRLYETNFIAPPAVVARRSAYEAAGSGYKDVLFCDHEMWLRLAAQADVGCLAAWDAEYRLHGTQTSSARRLELARHQFEVIEATRDLPIPERVRRRALAKAHARCALDEIERGQRRRALESIGRALASDPWSLARPSVLARVGAGLVALALGEPGRNALSRERTRRYLTRRSEPVS